MARLSSAKAATAVRIRFGPPTPESPKHKLGVFLCPKLRPSLLESKMKGAKTASAPRGALELSWVESSPCPGIVARRAAISATRNLERSGRTHQFEGRQSPKRPHPNPKQISSLEGSQSLLTLIPNSSSTMNPNSQEFHAFIDPPH